MIVEKCWLKTSMALLDDDDDSDDEYAAPGQANKWCLCGKDSTAPVTQCSNLWCHLCRWYHNKCVGQQPCEDEDWYCSVDCKETGVSIFCTCNLRKDGAERVKCANDDCRFGMWFHIQCLGLGNIPGVAGFFLPHIAQQVVHNRTINLTGGLGRNVSMDRLNEFYNREFKDVLSRSKGAYTTQVVQRAGMIVGALGKHLDRFFQKNVGETRHHRTPYQHTIDHKSIEEFMEEYHDDGFFNTSPGRMHRSFPKFTNDRQIPRPQKLKTKMLEMSHKLDVGKDICAKHN